ncbi:MAG: hypothetical protein IPK25_09605 [Saprospiraceae bacterium]|nr:hypothetical protein [Saprospiraceae bacterium]
MIEDWIKTKDQTGEDVYIGEIEYRPFAQQGNRDNKYRLLVKKKLRKDGQLNMFTNESYDYHAIVTMTFLHPWMKLSNAIIEEALVRNNLIF